MVFIPSDCQEMHGNAARSFVQSASFDGELKCVTGAAHLGLILVSRSDPVGIVPIASAARK